jgi:hypothetical protein
MQLIPNAKAQFIDQNGLPLASGTVGFYFPGTLNPKPTYQDAAGTIANTNPVQLDSRGQALIWGSGVYRQIVKDASGVTIWDQVTEDPNAGLTGNMTNARWIAGASYTDPSGSTPGTFVPGTTTTFNLPVAPGSIANIYPYFDLGFQQDDQISSLDGTTLVFASPVPNGTQAVEVKIGTTVAIGIPPSGSVTDATVAAGAGINSSKLSYQPLFAGGVRRTVQQKFGDFVTVTDLGAVGNGTTDNATDLQEMCTTGGNGFWIPAGQYKFGTGLTIDYSASGFPSPGTPSPRLDLIGEGMANSILNYSGTNYAVTLVGSDNSGAGQGIHSLDNVRGFTLQDAAQAQSNSGIAMTNRAWWALSDVIFQELVTGLNLSSCFSAKVSTSYFNQNQFGIQLNTTALGPCNEIAFESLVFQTNSFAAVLGNSIGSSLVFRDCSFESNGTQGNLATGGFVGNMSGIFGNAGPITFDNCYFENQAGVADISIDNTSTHALTILIRGCLFQRISNTNFVRNNISITSSGGGPVTVLLEGNSFFSAGSYVPDPSRPFFASGPNVTFVDNGGNVYSETISLPAIPVSGRTVASGAFAGASGTPLFARNATISRTGVGSYTVTFATPLPSAAYAPIITVDSTGQSAVGVAMTGGNASNFSFTVKNQSGTAFDPTSVFFAVFN